MGSKSSGFASMFGTLIADQVKNDAHCAPPFGRTCAATGAPFWGDLLSDLRSGVLFSTCRRLSLLGKAPCASNIVYRYLGGVRGIGKATNGSRLWSEVLLELEKPFSRSHGGEKC